MNGKKSKIPYAKKSFGQNFLVDQNYIGKIIEALDLQKDETIVEIGAGRGALTRKLLESGANVIAIELERDMIAILQGKFGNRENFQLIEQDALKIDFDKITENPKSEIRNPKSLKLVANLPYYISTAILQKLIEQRENFSEMILMFQREVVERITAEVGSKERGFLTVFCEAFLDAEKLFDVSPKAFRPSPKVWSAVVRLKPKSDDNFENVKLFRELVSASFTQKRKTILNNLKNAPQELKEKIGAPEIFLTESEIDPIRRAETLNLSEWEELFKMLK